jgi:transposase-like protein
VTNPFKHSDEVRTKAVAELRLRQASGVPIAGVGKAHGVSDATVYLWAKQSGDAPPSRKMRKPRSGNRASPEHRAAIVKAWLARKPGVHQQAFCKTHHVSHQALKNWVKEASAPKEQLEMTETQQETAAEPPKRQHTEQFKQRVVEAFVTRKAGVGPLDIAKQYGVHVSRVYAWHNETRNGKLAPVQKGTQLALSPPSHTNGASEYLESMPLEGLASMRLAQLEAQNKALRAIVKSLMENANQTDLKKINLLLLEQL